MKVAASEIQAAILACLRCAQRSATDGVTAYALARRITSVSGTTISNHLRQLKRDGIVHRLRDQGEKEFRWALPGEEPVDHGPARPMGRKIRRRALDGQS